MNWTYTEFRETLESRLGGIFDSLRRESDGSGLGSLIAPIEPFNRSRVLTPLVSAIGVASAMVLAGVALGALVTALAALVALYYLLTQIFGYEITLAVPKAPF